MRFTAEISCFESTFDTDTIEELDEDGDVGDLQVKKGSQRVSHKKVYKMFYFIPQK